MKASYLEGVLPGQQVDDLEAVLDDPDGQQLLAVVPAVHHQAVDQALHDGALGLAKPLGCVPEIRDVVEHYTNLGATSDLPAEWGM